MKVVIDDKIPYIKGILESMGVETLYISGSEINAGIVRDADALVIRTRTHCNRQLLEGSKVRFIATATIGFDHIDTEYCHQAGIVWRNAPGCNAASVAQYLQSVLILLKSQKGKKLDRMTMGIVGVGHVGSQVEKVARKWGMRVLLNDLPREDAEGRRMFVSLNQIMEESDVISFHVPLIKEGKYKTFHLADTDFFHSLKRRPFIINTSRGSVIETGALLESLKSEMISDACIDVWENEPNINLDLLKNVFIGTPHIAGYSADGKSNATQMSLHFLCNFFGLEENFHISPPAPADTKIQASSYEEALLKIYDPCWDSKMLKNNPRRFEYLRGNYPLRREETAYQIKVTG